MVIDYGSQWDLSVYNRNGQLTLVVEVKSKAGVSSDWAARLRHNIFAHGIFPKAPYFLMAFPEKFYLWANNDAYLVQSEPTYIVEPHSILQPYLERAGVTAKQISSQSLELIIASWLGEIIYSEKPPKNIDDAQGWLLDSGLYTALIGGRLELEAAA